MIQRLVWDVVDAEMIIRAIFFATGATIARVAWSSIGWTIVGVPLSFVSAMIGQIVACHIMRYFERIEI